ncbi:MAG: hypothetical protein ABID61_05260 [Candidatus Micrarchaeota archaeon]
MKGFVITILSVSLIMILIMLAISFRNVQLSTERVIIEPLPLIYAAFLQDDIGYEFNSIVGPQLDFDEKNDSMIITVNDQLRDYNYSAEISAYERFLIGEVASRTASNISTNFTNLTDGTIKLFINEDYIYTNNHSKNESVFTRNEGTGATSYDINVIITAIRENVTHMEFNDSGTLNVTISYTDLNGTVIEEGKLFPDQSNTLKIDYVGSKSMTIKIGPEDGNDGSLTMKSTGITANVAWTVVLPPLDANKKFGYEYDGYVQYIQGPVSLVRRIGK